MTLMLALNTGGDLAGCRRSRERRANRRGPPYHDGTLRAPPGSPGIRLRLHGGRCGVDTRRTGPEGTGEPRQWRGRTQVITAAILSALAMFALARIAWRRHAYKESVLSGAESNSTGIPATLPPPSVFDVASDLPARLPDVIRTASVILDVPLPGAVSTWGGDENEFFGFQPFSPVRRCGVVQFNDQIAAASADASAVITPTCVSKPLQATVQPTGSVGAQDPPGGLLRIRPRPGGSLLGGPVGGRCLALALLHLLGDVRGVWGQSWIGTGSRSMRPVQPCSSSCWVEVWRPCQRTAPSRPIRTESRTPESKDHRARTDDAFDPELTRLLRLSPRGNLVFALGNERPGSLLCRRRPSRSATTPARPPARGLRARDPGE